MDLEELAAPPCQAKVIFSRWGPCIALDSVAVRSRKTKLSSLTGLVGLLLTLGCSKASAERAAPQVELPKAQASASADSSGGEVVPANAAPSRAAPLAMPSAEGSSPAARPSQAASPLGNATLTLSRAGENVPAALAHRVLHFGDSMVPLVGNYLRPWVEKQGGRYEIVSTSSSTTLSWAKQDTLKHELAELDPELVLISLGSNELFFVDDLAERGAAVRAIVQAVGERACLWIGPPAWAKDRGFLDVLKDNLGSCRYFDSTVLPMDRQEDGRHPTFGASYRWAIAVWERLGGDKPASRR